MEMARLVPRLGVSPVGSQDMQQGELVFFWSGPRTNSCTPDEVWQSYDFGIQLRERLVDGIACPDGETPHVDGIGIF